MTLERHSRSRRRGYLLIGAILAVATPAGARVGADDWHSQPYEHDGLTIVPRTMELKKGKLWLKLQFVNSTEGTMTISPDAIPAKLPTGATVPRLKGVVDAISKAHGTRTLAPGTGAEIAIEYQVGEVKSVALQLGYAVAVDGKVRKLPEWLTTSTIQWSADRIQQANLVVSLVSSTGSKGGFEIRLKVENRNDAPIYIDKKLFKAKLPGGSVVDREKTLLKNWLTILGHSDDEFNVEFKVGEPVAFSVSMDGINNGVLGLPDLALKRL